MPKIQFANLPRPVWQHLLQRVDERRISVADLMALQEWVKTGPVAPVGDWFKDFGSFILCGTGQFPKTVLEKGMKPFGSPIPERVSFAVTGAVRPIVQTGRVHAAREPYQSLHGQSW